MLSKATIVLAVSLATSGISSAGDTVAVLSSASGVYMEAFSAFRKGYGEEVQHFDLSKKNPVIPPGTRTVVAFGSRAAGMAYPPGVNLVYALAPGYIAPADGRTGAIIKISMLARPDIFLARLREIQPTLKKLRIFWRSPDYAGLPHNYEAAGSRVGIDIKALRVDREEDIPGLLRKTLGQEDAFWLPPDPLLISEATLPMFVNFSQDNGVPMYVSTEGMAKKGACAAIGVGFDEAGEAAALAVKELNAGSKLASVIYPSDYHMTLNASAARYCGIQFPPSLISRAHHYLP